VCYKLTSFYFQKLKILLKSYKAEGTLTINKLKLVLLIIIILLLNRQSY